MSWVWRNGNESEHIICQIEEHDENKLFATLSTPGNSRWDVDHWKNPWGLLFKQEQIW